MKHDASTAPNPGQPADASGGDAAGDEADGDHADEDEAAGDEAAGDEAAGDEAAGDEAAVDDLSEDDAAERARLDELVDEMGRESFPASDPPSTWAGPDPARHPSAGETWPAEHSGQRGRFRRL